MKFCNVKGCNELATHLIGHKFQPPSIPYCEKHYKLIMEERDRCIKKAKEKVGNEKWFKDLLERYGEK